MWSDKKRGSEASSELKYCIQFDRLSSQDFREPLTNQAKRSQDVAANTRSIGDILRIDKAPSKVLRTSKSNQCCVFIAKFLICATLLVNTAVIFTWYLSSGSISFKPNVDWRKQGVIDSAADKHDSAQKWRKAKDKQQFEYIASEQTDAQLTDVSDLSLNRKTRALYCSGSHKLTVVTAYFNIGSFPKGFFGGQRSAKDYASWVRGFSSLANPIMFFTDDLQVKNLFEKWLDPQHSATLCTRTYLINSTELWPFRSLGNISAALRSKQYFPAPPVTSHPTYTAATLSKYTITQKAVRMNPFKTPHFVWLDFGIYRNSISKSELESVYVLDPPPDLMPNEVGYLEIIEKPQCSAEEFFLQHYDWISGGVFFAKTSTMLKWVKEFDRYARAYMQQQLVGADQQVLGAMFSGADDTVTKLGPPNVAIKLYRPALNFTYDPWFFLAYNTRRKLA